MEFAQWWAFYQLEPWGSREDWYRSAVIAATIANVNRSRSTPVRKVEDFMPQRDARQTLAQQKAQLRAYFKALAATGQVTIVRKKHKDAG